MRLDLIAYFEQLQSFLKKYNIKALAKFIILKYF